MRKDCFLTAKTISSSLRLSSGRHGMPNNSGRGTTGKSTNIGLLTMKVPKRIVRIPMQGWYCAPNSERCPVQQTN